MQIIEFNMEAAGEVLDTAQAVVTLDSVAKRARLSVNNFTGTLVYLKGELTRLRQAFQLLAAPIAKVLVPTFHRAIASLTAFVTDVAALIASIFGYVLVTADKTVTSTGKALRRSLADFDQIQRLNGDTGGSSSYTVPGEVIQLPAYLQEAARRLREALEPLREALGRLWQTLQPIFAGLQVFFQWVLDNVLVPLAEWTAGKALPAFLDTLGSAIELLAQLVLVATPTLLWLFESWLVPLGQWTGDAVLAALEALRSCFDDISLWIEQHRELLQFLFYIVTAVTQAFLLAAAGVAAFLTAASPVTGLCAAIVAAAVAVTKGINAAVDALWELRNQGMVTYDSLHQGFRDMLTGCIAMFNGVVTGAQNAVNTMIRSVNGISLSIPDWVPGYGGKRLGFSLRTVSFPKIPQLARGAVLPPNAPFLAVVGDQRHGTNIEAPLATIQEAVALTMEDLSAGNMAGHAATVDVLERLLDAVVSIRIGDETIAAACDRHRIKAAMMKGA